MARTKGAKGLHNRYNIKQIVKTILDYTEGSPLPILKEVCFQNDWDYDYIMQLQRENELLRLAVKRLLMKKEILLEKAMYTGENNTGFIFSLKQLGWKDKPEPIIVNNMVQNNQGGNRSEKLRKVTTETLEQLEEIYKEIDSQVNSDKSTVYEKKSD